MKICWLEFSCENPWWTLKAKFSEVKSKEAKLSIIRISDFCKLLCVKLKWKQGNLWVTELRILQYYLGLQGMLLDVLQNLFHVDIMPLTEIIEVIYAAEVGLDGVLM